MYTFNHSATKYVLSLKELRKIKLQEHYVS